VLNNDRSRAPKVIQDGKESRRHQSIPYQLIFPGGDTQAVSNVEYRIPIVGPVTWRLLRPD
jgi:outer membrane protein insertion porin family